MTLGPKEKIDLSRYRFDKAKEMLRDAKSLLNSGGFESSVNRSYYAVLSSARSLLVLRGIDAESHDGVKTMFSKEFIKTGLISGEFADTFRTLQARRIDSDYGDFVEIGKDKAAESFERAKEFVKKVEELVKVLTKDVK